MRVLVIKPVPDNDNRPDSCLPDHPLLSGLERAGYEVVIAACDTEGLSLALDQSIGLVILDLVGVGGPGLGVCQRIREDSSVPIVVLGSYWADETIAALRLGADQYVSRPVAPELLTAYVRAVLRRFARQPAQVN
jgi:DNA-binding response OmpR family regulator